jgi:hypothetical protein
MAVSPVLVSVRWPWLVLAFLLQRRIALFFVRLA